MTARERTAGTSATAMAVPPHADGCNGIDPAVQRILHWDEWLQTASADQWTEMLALASRYGLLHPGQIPRAANGVRQRLALENPARLHVLAQILGGKIDGLAPVVPQSLSFFDLQLGKPQREAVARALCTPDVFLLEAFPGTGRSRVLAEIFTQAAVRGHRVLYLARRSCAIDASLVHVRDSQAVLAVRFLDAAERLAALPSEIMPFTLRERQRSFTEKARCNAAKAKADAELLVRRRQDEEGRWAPLRELADKLAQTRQRLRENGEQSSKMAEDVHREANAGATSESPLAARIAQLASARAGAVGATQRELSEQEQERAAAASELAVAEQAIEVLRPLAEAKQHGRWWTMAWWRATWRGRVLATMDEMSATQRVLQATLQALEQARQDKQARCRQLEAEFEASREQLLQAEIDCRREVGLQQESDLRRLLHDLTDEWQRQLELLDPAHRPVDETPAALAAAKACWDHQRELDKAANQFARRWADCLAQAGDQLGAQVLSLANVLAGTTAALASDKTFAAALAASPVDLLILDEADQFTEADVLQLARHAGRWVFAAANYDADARPAVPADDGGRVRPSGQMVPRLGFFQKLWKNLHCDSRRLHYAWSTEGGRRCCTLRSVSGRERAYLEIEHVADFPEIELRILAIPKAAPQLAQVVFPADMTLHQAKEFIYRELEEATIQEVGRGAWLADEADSFVFHLDPLPRDDAVPLDLQKGLREWVVPATAQTCRLEFARPAGWTRSLVDQWLQRHLEVHDLGRTMAMQVSYRMADGLAGPVNKILFGDACVAAPKQHVGGILEFIAVPTVRKGIPTERRKLSPGANGSSSLPREGAGFEVDLASPRGADRIPSELRAQLPRHGFANYLEAQAVIRKLEELAAQGGRHKEPIAVIALYEGQATLLRRMAELSDSLRPRLESIEIGVPNAFREREWTTVLVSLTRSHGHRAVPFGERESDLALALTRARRQLILFGDPGALVKRSHWNGPLDQLDAVAAASEARRVGALVTCIFSAGG